MIGYNCLQTVDNIILDIFIISSITREAEILLEGKRSAAQSKHLTYSGAFI